MDVSLALVIAVVVVALVFDYTNGFHDAANAIATSVSTRALTPRIALAMAAIMNFIGAFLGTEVADTIGSIIAGGVEGEGAHGLTVVLGALAGAIVWNLITWYFGLPSSSSHALIGGLVGAGVASSSAVKWDALIDKVLIPMVVSPLIGFGGAFMLMIAILWTFRHSSPWRVGRGFRFAQTISAAGMALGHGLQDAQKTMGVIFLALLASGHYSKDDGIPLWVKISAATAISLGTYSGGWRIMRTLGRRIIDLDPARGFASETVASIVLYVMAMGLGAPVSTTHTITSSVMGAGATKRFSAVRWGVARSIIVAWIVTIPAAALVAAIVYWICALFLP
ncbi:inorganic phosphate transporter [Solicola gregarius]|uniref:Inorganic phosphate transporter n=1 Tax=Solicola gregarius TaxID=2908642 RepID=A0AA46YIZ5_9ACTN|nr:inorganic phosphate transporter [Solicola gregarius]UYM03612.1 inorganic phosphate transporter [Solicola gregarius]